MMYDLNESNHHRVTYAINEYFSKPCIYIPVLGPSSIKPMIADATDNSIRLSEWFNCVGINLKFNSTIITVTDMDLIIELKDVKINHKLMWTNNLEIIPVSFYTDILLYIANRLFKYSPDKMTFDIIDEKWSDLHMVALRTPFQFRWSLD